MNRTQSALNTGLKSPVFMPAILTITLFIINWILQPNLFSAPVFRINILTFSPVVLIAIGQAIIMINGNLDLSVGYGVSLINCILTTYFIVDPSNTIWNIAVVLIALCAAIVMGLINGILVGYLKVNSFIGTFASSFVWLGIAIMIRPEPGGSVPDGFTKFFKAYVGPFNVIFLIIIVSLVFWSILRQYKVGRYIYAAGSSLEAAYRNGVNVKVITLVTFALGWVFVFLGTLTLTAQTRSGDVRVGEPFALISIAAAVIGGVSMQGGKGSTVGAALGAVSLSIIMNIIYFAGIPTSSQVLVRGIIIIIAIGATVFYKRKFD